VVEKDRTKTPKKQSTLFLKKTEGNPFPPQPFRTKEDYGKPDFSIACKIDENSAKRRPQRAADPGAKGNAGRKRGRGRKLASSDHPRKELCNFRKKKSW